MEFFSKGCKYLGLLDLEILNVRTVESPLLICQDSRPRNEWGRGKTSKQDTEMRSIHLIWTDKNIEIRNIKTVELDQRDIWTRYRIDDIAGRVASVYFVWKKAYYYKVIRVTHTPITTQYIMGQTLGNSRNKTQ